MTKTSNRSKRFAATNFWALLFAFVFPTIVTLVYFQWLAGSESKFQKIAYSIGKVLQFVFPVAWVVLMDREFWATERGALPFLKAEPADNRRGLSGLWIGLGFGVMVTVLMALVYYVAIAGSEVDSHLIEMVKEKVAGIGVNSPWKFLALGLFYALVHSFLEEYYWRWFVFGYLCRFGARWSAAVLSSLGFMAHHVVLLAFFFGWDSPLTYLISSAIAVGGVFWAWLYSETRSLAGPWLSHLVVDAGIFGLGFLLVRDSIS